MADSPYFIFSGQFLCFVMYFSSFPIVFGFCLFSFLILLWFLLLFLCSLWFLKFSLDALADSLPQLFSKCFQFFFFPYDRNTDTGWEISALGLYCSHETLAKLFLFWTPHCGWSVCVARLPGSASAPDAMCGPHVGQKSRLREEIRIFWWCWRWCLLPSSVSVPD